MSIALISNKKEKKKAETGDGLDIEVKWNTVS